MLTYKALLATLVVLLATVWVVKGHTRLKQTELSGSELLERPQISFPVRRYRVHDSLNSRNFPFDNRSVAIKNNDETNSDQSATISIIDSILWRVKDFFTLHVPRAMSGINGISEESTEISPKIITGDNVDESNRKKFCYQVSISKSDPDDQLHFCGGVIIHKRYVLTAAHCLVSKDESSITILAGLINLIDETGIQERSAAKFFNHENFTEILKKGNNTVWVNDIALIELESEFNLDENTCIIKIAESDPKTRTDCKISGWGIYNQDVQLNSEFLRSATIPIISDSDCRKMFKNLIREGNFCAGFTDGRGDACQGDSGGPMVCQNELVGIISWGLENCTMPGFAGVYANVTFYKDWIESHMPSANGPILEQSQIGSMEP